MIACMAAAGFAVPPSRAGAGRSRPNSASACYLARPARLGIAVMRPRHGRAALQRLTDAVTSG